ncbi:hypothetical protein JHK82_040063 [Glycine max]|nr:hypothetical protein JHK82_040063 [Glycine max]
MEIPDNRKWMYQRTCFKCKVNKQGVYKKCKCKVFKFVDDVIRDLYEEGFMPIYYWWTNHGEELPQFPSVVLHGSYYESDGQREELNPYEQMIMDHAGP